MNDSLISKKHFLIALIIGLVFLLKGFFDTIGDTHTKIVFCDVGQGDAAYIRINNRTDILIDAGPDSKVVDCLSKYMPFFDRTIELAFISHAQKDHANGFSYVADHYRIEDIFANSVKEPKTFYINLLEKLKKQNVRLHQGVAGMRLSLEDVEISFLSPTRPSLKLATAKTNLNDLSEIFLFVQGKTRILFTGDASPLALNNIAKLTPHNITILKIPHHGSKNGLTKEFFYLTSPKISVISVGKNNRYGHPSQLILDLLRASKTIIRRTDLEGDVVFRF